MYTQDNILGQKIGINLYLNNSFIFFENYALWEEQSIKISMSYKSSITIIFYPKLFELGIKIGNILAGTFWIKVL